jgi:hypothetical protein
VEELVATEDGRKEMNPSRRTGGRSESTAEDGRKEMNSPGQEREVGELVTAEEEVEA